jgi:hypothetical protein
LRLETYWQKAAGGIIPQGRYAWDENEKKQLLLKKYCAVQMYSKAE